MVHTNADDDTPVQVVRSQGDHVGSRPSARSAQHPGGFAVQSRPDTEHWVDDGHGASTTRVCQVGRAIDRLVCNIHQQMTHQVCIAISGPQGRVDGRHVSALGQQEGPPVCFPTIEDGRSSSAEDRSVTRNQGDSDRSTATGNFLVSWVDGSGTGRSNHALRRGSNTADSRRSGRRWGDGNASLPAVKSTCVETLRAVLRAIPRKLRTWCQGPFVTHHSRCMNPIGQDSCPSVGRKDGPCFESEAIILAPIWCICSETDSSHRRLCHIARLWRLCYVIGFTIRQPIRT